MGLKMFPKRSVSHLASRAVCVWLQYVDPIMDRLDPKGCVRYRLYRDATHYTHGKHMRVRASLPCLSLYAEKMEV